MLYYFSPAGDQFAFGQTGQDICVSQYQAGLIESSYDIFSFRMIHRYFTTNTGIYHSYQAGGDLYQGTPRR